MLNDAFIRSAPKGVHWDGTLKGFGLRVGKNRKSFIVLVASGRRKSIGTWPLTTLAAARSLAKTMLAEKQLGKIHPTHTAFDDAKAAFLKDCESCNKPRTIQDYRRLLTRHLPFARVSVADITPRKIINRIEPLRRSEKHHAFTAARRFFRYCVQQHLIERSPMEGMAVPAAGGSRARVLTPDELRAIYQTAVASTGTFERIVALLVLTGQRRGEISRLEWDWIDRDRITLPGHVTKNKREHTFSIGPQAQALIQSCVRWNDHPYLFPALRRTNEHTTVFNGWGKPKARFDKACGVTGWTLHDLRRTLSSMWAAEPLSVPQIVCEKYLNHVSGGVISPIAAVYNRHAFFEEQRQAVLKWEAYLGTLLTAR